MNDLDLCLEVIQGHVNHCGVSISKTTCLETSNLVSSFLLGILSKHTNNFPESGRGLGHVTPTIFGSTVGYPSDSLASCSFLQWWI